MRIIDSPTERTTAATDLLITLLAGHYLLELGRRTPLDPWKARLWTGVFATLSSGAGLGAAAHGLEMSQSNRDRIWLFIDLNLASTVGLFVTGAVRDRWGEQTAQRVLPGSLLAAFVFALVRRRFPGSFLAFIVYATIGMLFALSIYSDLARRKALPGAPQIVAGVILVILASVVQTRSLRISLFGLPFDNNGMYHLILIAALPPLAGGLRASLETTDHQSANQ